MRITLITGADGAAFAHDLGTSLSPDDRLTVIAPTVRGHISAGLLASPDLDGLLTPPGSAATFATADALEAIGYAPRWQRASDQAIAARIVRTDLTANGTSLTDATIAAATRSGLPYRLLPACEDRAEFRVVIGTDDPRAIHVEQYLADPAAHEATQLLLVADQITISPAVAQALAETDVLVLGPSSRTLAIDPVLRTPRPPRADHRCPPDAGRPSRRPGPGRLVTVAGLSEPDPGRFETVPADAVLDHARKVTA
ncbi:2-phospho-L-lactate transferase CofD family protein [Aeromicrobium sp. UC242_57]|uniref:2-phospho-L-lactate transferase CofD family protein n=1 Tax=Aeromicrobium sp. UC242_57 TaxID=3374624 RepID=UPI0037B2C59B